MRSLLILAATLALASATADAATTPSAGAAKTPSAGVVKTPPAGVVKTPLAGAVTAPPVPQHFVYNILRNGSPIGQNVLDLDKQGGVTSVNMTSDVDVKIMFMSVYAYHYAGNETWSDDQLIAFKSQTNDNGTMHNVTIGPNGDQLELDADGHRSFIAKTTGLDDFWMPLLLSKPLVLDTSDGHGMNFVAEDLGMEMITYHGAPRPARHFRLTGDVNRDLWFDADTPVRFQIKARDGSMIVSELQ
jgi:hypothetical protein